jgi:hypothetical protein
MQGSWRTRIATWSITSLVLACTAQAAWADNGNNQIGHEDVCPAATVRYARCLSKIVTLGGTPMATPAPAGYGPADLWGAYKLSTPPALPSGGGTQTIAIVDAFHDPNAESDLAHYRTTFGLGACTTASGCFRQVNQNGLTAPYPRPDPGWAEEISLDLDMASAICPKCKILLVEATTNYMTDLGAAVNTAARLGATQISNSYGSSEYASETADQAYYNHGDKGIDVTVSSGDYGYGAEFPAASQWVTAVGGTTLRSDTSARGWGETVWSGAGSGCSAYIPKPSWQKDTGCARRTIADVSAVADPATGVAVYDTYLDPGWLVFGGTSVSAPIIAGVDALAGGRSPGTSYGSFPYSHQSLFFDVVAGSNGTCSPAYLCTGVVGYDGPTGWGTPNTAGTPAPPPPPAPAPTVSALALNPTTVTGGASGSSTGTVTLSGPAPTGGATVTLSSNNAAATVAASVGVAAGATSATFPVTTSAVTTSQSATITGTYNSSSRSAVLTVNPAPAGPTVSALALNPTTVTGGASGSSTGTVTLSGPAPTGGATVNLSSNNAAAAVPSSVVVAAGATSATFTVTTSAVTTSQSATITGSYNSSSRSAVLTINPAPAPPPPPPPRCVGGDGEC